MTVRSRATVPVVLVFIVVVALLGCARDVSLAGPSVAPSQTPATPTAPASPGIGAADGAPDEATVAPIPAASTDGQAAALAAAETAVSTFAQPGLDAATWMTRMYPLLTQRGAQAYEGTDPAQIPVRYVTGPGQVLDGSTDVALIVQIPTDAGLYTVSLSRTDASAVWLVEQLRPASGS